MFLTISQWAIPVLLLIILGAGFRKKIHLYEIFVQGAMEGLKTTIRLAPYLVAIFVAVGIFRASGVLDVLACWLKLIFKQYVPAPELLTLGLLKPLSGSASLGVTAEILQKYGPDGTQGITASLIQASNETTFYVLSLYLGAVNLKHSRHLLLVGLICELVAFILALWFGTFLAR